MDISVVLITKDRKESLYNKLSYYNNIGLNILVADSSETPCDQGAISSLCKNVQYYHYNCPFLEKIKKTVARVKTKYIMLAPDDDFFCFNGISACVKWLDENMDFNAAQGKWIGFCDEIREKYIEIYREPNQEREEDTAVERFFELWRNPSQWFYCVMRTNSIQECFQKMGDHYEADKYVEIIISSAIAIYGKLKILPVLYGVGKIHDQTPHKSAAELRAESLSGVYNGWEYMENDLAKLIADFDKVEYDSVRNKVRDALYLYCHPNDGRIGIVPWIKGYLNKLPIIRNQIVYTYFKKSDFRYSLKDPFKKDDLAVVEKYIWTKG